MNYQLREQEYHAGRALSSVLFRFSSFLLSPASGNIPCPVVKKLLTGAGIRHCLVTWPSILFLVKLWLMRSSCSRVGVLMLGFAFATSATICLFASAQATDPSTSVARAATLFKQAGEFLNAGSYEQARERTVVGLEHQPRSAAGLNLLGLIYGNEK